MKKGGTSGSSRSFRNKKSGGKNETKNISHKNSCRPITFNLGMLEGLYKKIGRVKVGGR